MESHNLNIHMYTLNDILDLFKLSINISEQDLKNAKKQVLMMHPDKSKLPSDYFLFFKKAFEIIVHMYEQQHKQDQEVMPKEYQLESVYDNDKTINKQVVNNLQNISERRFKKQFNELFEENMADKIDTSRNDWFISDKPIYEIDVNVNKNSIGSTLQDIRTNQTSLVRHNGVQTLNSNTTADSLYKDENDETYKQCDPFSKLKYDDLRKVHKDETIFSVSEKDYDNIPKYSSTEHYVRVRNSEKMVPLTTKQSHQQLSRQDNQYRERILQKEYQSLLETKKYEEKNKTIISKFLRIAN